MTTVEPLPAPVPATPVPALRRHALLVEDDDAVRRSLQLLLHGRGFAVRSFATAHAVLTGEIGDADSLVTDYRLPDGDGVAVLGGLRARGWAGRAVLITAFPSLALRRLAQAAGFDTVLEKPLRHHALIAALSPP